MSSEFEERAPHNHEVRPGNQASYGFKRNSRPTLGTTGGHAAAIEGITGN